MTLGEDELHAIDDSALTVSVERTSPSRDAADTGEDLPVQGDQPACSSLLDAISTARFQQRLMALVGEKEALSRRVRSLEQKLARADVALQSALDDKSDTQAAVRAAERKLQEADAVSERHRAALDAQKARHELLARLADEQATEATRRIGEQAQQIHALTEQLSSATSNLGGLRACQRSSEELIDSFHTKIAEVSFLLENMRQAERVCRSTMVRVAEEQRGFRSQLSALERAHLLVEGRTRLGSLLREARETAEANDALATQRQHELDLAARQLQMTRDGHQDVLAVARQMRQAAGERDAQLRQKDQVLNEQSRQADGALRRNMFLTETNDLLRGELRRKEAVVQLLLREIGHADALAHSADRLAILNTRAESAEVVAARARTVALHDELRESAEARQRSAEAHAAMTARLAEIEEDLLQCRLQIDEYKRLAEVSKIGDADGKDEKDGIFSIDYPPVHSQLNSEGTRTPLKDGLLASASQPRGKMVHVDTTEAAADAPADVEFESSSPVLDHGIGTSGFGGMAGHPPDPVQPAKRPHAASLPDDGQYITLGHASAASETNPTQAPAQTCTKCADVLFGLIEYCSACHMPFHNMCTQTFPRTQGRFTCAACAPTGPKHASKRSRNTLAMVKKNSLLA